MKGVVLLVLCLCGYVEGSALKSWMPKTPEDNAEIIMNLVQSGAPKDGVFGKIKESGYEELAHIAAYLWEPGCLEQGVHKLLKDRLVLELKARFKDMSRFRAVYFIKDVSEKLHKKSYSFEALSVRALCLSGHLNAAVDMLKEHASEKCLCVLADIIDEYKSADKNPQFWKMIANEVQRRKLIMTGGEMDAVLDQVQEILPDKVSRLRDWVEAT